MTRCGAGLAFPSASIGQPVGEDHQDGRVLNSGGLRHLQRGLTLAALLVDRLRPRPHEPTHDSSGGGPAGSRQVERKGPSALVRGLGLGLGRALVRVQQELDDLGRREFGSVVERKAAEELVEANDRSFKPSVAQRETPTDL